MIGKYLWVFLISMVPIIELRGAIPVAVGMGLPLIPSYIICIIGNMLPVPFIYFFARKVLVWGSDKPVIGKFFTFCLEKGEKGGKKTPGKSGQRPLRCPAPFRGNPPSRNRSLDRYPGSQPSGYGFQVQRRGCYVRRSPGRRDHGADQ